MKAKELQLANQYIEYERKLAEITDNMRATLEELKTLAPHKKGEVIRYKKAPANTEWVPLTLINGYPCQFNMEERKAVVTNVEANVFQIEQTKELCIKFQYSFCQINKDGSISKNHCYPSNYEWTGEMYELK